MRLVIHDHDQLKDDYPYSCVVPIDLHGPIHMTQIEWFRANIPNGTDYAFSTAMYFNEQGLPLSPYGIWVGFKQQSDYLKFCLTWL